MLYHPMLSPVTVQGGFGGMSLNAILSLAIYLTMFIHEISSERGTRTEHEHSFI